MEPNPRRGQFVRDGPSDGSGVTSHRLSDNRRRFESDLGNPVEIRSRCDTLLATNYSEKPCGGPAQHVWRQGPRTALCNAATAILNPRTGPSPLREWGLAVSSRADEKKPWSPSRDASRSSCIGCGSTGRAPGLARRSPIRNACYFRGRLTGQAAHSLGAAV